MATEVVEVGGKLIRYTVVAGTALMHPDLYGIDRPLKRAHQRCTWQRRMIAITKGDGPTGSEFFQASALAQRAETTNSESGRTPHIVIFRVLIWLWR